MNVNYVNEKKIDKTPLRCKNFMEYLVKDNIKVLANNIFSTKVYQDGKLKRKSIFYIMFEIQPTSSSMTYTLLFVYKERGTPYIYVLNPNLYEFCEKGIKIPHLYDHKRLRLCLYYPAYSEYEGNDYIAEQIIPWTKLWLYHYEVWLYTKEWLGGGIHPGDEKDINVKEKQEKKRVLTSFKNKKTKQMKKTNEYSYLSISNNIYFEAKKALNEVA